MQVAPLRYAICIFICKNSRLRCESLQKNLSRKIIAMFYKSSIEIRIFSVNIPFTNSEFLISESEFKKGNELRS